MDQNTLLTVMTVFVAIAALALVVQMAVMIGLYRATRTAQQRISDILPQVEQLIHVSHTSIEQGRQELLDITGKTSEILTLAHTQVARVDDIVADATARARVQLERAELVIEDALSRSQQTIAVLHSGVMRPLREIQGITAGVKAAIAFLAKGTRASVNQITTDEEMFI
jgi:hypothetical protein